MGMVINNLRLAFGEKWLKRTTKNVTDDLEKLASGYKINRSADDASGLTISEKMKAQIKALDTASANAEDGISLVQTAEGYLNEIQAMLTRSVELSLKAANGILTDGALPAKHGTISEYEEMLLTGKGDERCLLDETDKFGGDRAAIELEFRELKEEMDRISKTANFNNILLFDGSLADSGRTEYRDVVVGKKPATEIPETEPPVTITIPGARPTEVAPLDPPTTTIPIGSVTPTEVAKNSPDLVIIPAAATPPTVTYAAPGVVTKAYEMPPMDIWDDSELIPSGTLNSYENTTNRNKYFNGSGELEILDNNGIVGVGGDVSTIVGFNLGTVNIDSTGSTIINGNNGTINVHHGSSVKIDGDNNGTINLYGTGFSFDSPGFNSGGIINQYTYAKYDLTEALNSTNPKIKLTNFGAYESTLIGTITGDNISYDLSDIRNIENGMKGDVGGDYNIILEPAALAIDGYVLSYEDNGGNYTTDINNAYKLIYTPIEGFVRTVPKSGTEEIDWIANKFSSITNVKSMDDIERKYIQDLMNSDWLPSGEGVTISGDSKDDINAIKTEIGALMEELSNPDGSLKSVSDSYIKDMSERITELLSQTKSFFALAAGSAAETIPSSGTAELDWLINAFSSEEKFMALSNEERLYIKGLIQDPDWYPEGVGVTLSDSEKNEISGNKSTIQGRLNYVMSSDGSSDVWDPVYLRNMSDEVNSMKSTLLDAAPKIPARESDPIPTSGTAELDWLINAFSSEEKFIALSNEERLYIKGLIQDPDWYPEGVGVTLSDSEKNEISGNKSTIQGRLNYIMSSDGSSDVWDPVDLRNMSDEVNSIKTTFLKAAATTTTKEIPMSGDAAFDYLDDVFSSAAKFNALSDEEKDAIEDIFSGNTLGIDSTASSGIQSLLFGGGGGAVDDDMLTIARDTLNTERAKLLASLPEVDDVKTMAFTTESGGKGVELQIGETSRNADRLVVNIDQIDSQVLGLSDLSLLTVEGANKALLPIRLAINKISDQRARLGAYQNRLDYTIQNLNTASENISNANSRIRDTDVAKQQTKFVSNQILQQTAGRTVQISNENASNVLRLLG